MFARLWKRHVGVLLAVAALAVPAVASGSPPRTTSAVDALESGVLAEVNAVRTRHNLAPLRLSPTLSSAASAHSRAMADRGFFSHASLDGTSFWKRVQRFYPSSGFEYWSVGENLLWRSPSVSPAEAVRMWLVSPPHRKNLLAPQWREVGLAALHVSAAPGTFAGLDVTIVTADFGVRR